jgi:dimethylhistidine N-methyltransferase
VVPLALLFDLPDGVSRLARYNVTADSLSAGSDKVRHYAAAARPEPWSDLSRSPSWAVHSANGLSGPAIPAVSGPGHAACLGAASTLAAAAMPDTLSLADRPRQPAGADDSSFARDVLRGLSNWPHRIPPKYFYDAAGSALFDRICELPEYYPTRTELAILSERAPEMAAQIGPRSDLIEFGAGSMSKVRLLLDAFDAADMPLRYLPIDISGEHLLQAARRLQQAYPRMAVVPMVADCMAALSLPAPPSGTGRRVGFFPGSTFGNFSAEEASCFLQRSARLLQGGGLLIGVDLVKDPALLQAAYNDAHGVTAAFNLNLLRRVNTELGGDFDLDAFAHHAFYDPLRQRVEMHLVSRRTQTVRVGAATFRFAEGDSLHTENSQKFTIDGFRALALRSGFRPGPVWQDKRRLFAVHWLRAP